ncbi:Metal-dependent hydrolase, endonuclease/exonuclease/phosphatase family [Mariniphaga anaerophila]|uniref:Metal-dependent hydrolase, endonuclease/exonuclease/phosphatase family n=1 Tax=Mariniphaga anaerophila TaxID=1484053 RepID=A0A1M5FAC2_9BACT|nr:endonuclease/exonuclease/phosphatase family protein [Mariniphaga anaerophila]SHF88457.1 Metal-dependent hydrolase, endonuclease/exonuclease/phosphatase family [Mariniphaga anaerophila]
MKKLIRAFIIIVILIFGWRIISAQPRMNTKNDTLKVLCYNLRFGELASLEQLADFIKSQNPDIIALQEVDVKTYRERAPLQNGKDFITELGFRTGMLTAYAKTIPYAGGYYGIGILSKYPFLQTKRVMLPMPNGSKEQRALLLADVELADGKIITMVCTHLDYPSSEVRQLQVKALNNALKENPYPLIVAGDFNAQPDSPEISQGMASWKQVSSFDFTIPSHSPQSKIDYIFVSPIKAWTVISTETPRVTLSDHLPVAATLELVY